MGKTLIYHHWFRDEKKHPHACGEDTPLPPSPAAGAETPPRLWGRQQGLLHTIDRYGNTPTPVGKTSIPFSQSILMKKHPHACGEDLKTSLPRQCRSETPPRLWGRPQKGRWLLQRSRNTPTPVGKTHSFTEHGFVVGKHPHACGEDVRKRFDNDPGQETPPRLWGRLEIAKLPILTLRNTPTPVGKTYLLACPWPDFQKHPHACGEDEEAERDNVYMQETPPRLWGRPFSRSQLLTSIRNTPTPVGKTRINP